ncbi:MAG TPA: DUF4112 domain-containing protein [Chthoniobacterales bacterium]|jgi:hypothetical protein
MAKYDPNDGDVEVVSPGGKGYTQPQTPTAPADPLFALISKVMDNVFVIPGTNIRFGIDPIIGLIPGLGDTSGALISSMLIFRGAQAGVPKVVLARMALNVLVNAIFGGVPFLGDLFSIWFKSNQMNYELYQKHAGGRTTASKSDWVFVISLLVALLVAVGCVIALSLTVIAALWKAINN